MSEIDLDAIEARRDEAVQSTRYLPLAQDMEALSALLMFSASIADIGLLCARVRQLEAALAHCREDLRAGTEAWARDRQRVTELEADNAVLCGRDNWIPREEVKRALKAATKAERERCLVIVNDWLRTAEEDYEGEAEVALVKVREAIEADAR